MAWPPFPGRTFRREEDVGRGHDQSRWFLLRMTPDSTKYWNAHVAGVALGLILLATFVLTGHGLGASGFTTALAVMAAKVADPSLASANQYFGPMLESGRNPLDTWISWQIAGVAIGGLMGSLAAGGFRWRIDGPPRLRTSARLAMAALGGVLAGFGARISAGCTSGLGLSGSATLAIAGFVFLMGFFAVGLASGFALRRFWR
jgi:hypothetical protein